MKSSQETEIPTDITHIELRPILECIGKYSDLNHSIIERLAILSRLFPGIFNLKLCDTLKSHLDETFKRSVEQVNAGKPVEELTKMAAAICEVIPLIQHAGQNVDVFKNLVGTVVKAEQDLGFSLVKIHPHLVKFCQTLISYNIRNCLDVFLEGQKPGDHLYELTYLSRRSFNRMILCWDYK